MRRPTFETVSVVHQIRCDRCGKEAERGDVDFEQMISINLNAGPGSIFGHGNRVEADLCEICLRDMLGPWLRVKTPADAPYAKMHPAFKSETGSGMSSKGEDQ